LSAILARLTVPPRSTVEQPSIRHSAPSVAAPGQTPRVAVEFSVPAGYFYPNPRVITVPEPDPYWQFLTGGNFQLTQPPPNGKGYADLHMPSHPPGVYRVRAELGFSDGQGNNAWVVSP
jgi:hypothetical protein